MAAIDTTQGGLGQPATWGELVTKHDTNELTRVSRALYVGGTGDVAVVMLEGSAVTFVGVPAGALLPIRVKKVMSTGTTATTIISLA